MREILVCAGVMTASAVTTASTTTTDSTSGCNQPGKYGLFLNNCRQLQVTNITMSSKPLFCI